MTREQVEAMPAGHMGEYIGRACFYCGRKLYDGNAVMAYVGYVGRVEYRSAWACAKCVRPARGDKGAGEE